MPAQTTIQFRRGTAAQWTTANPVLAAGEQGFETDTGKLKIGDGVKNWSQLPFYQPGTVDTSTLTTQAQAYALAFTIGG